MKRKKQTDSKPEDWVTGSNADKLRDWCSKGLSDYQIAKNMGICRATLWNWKAKCKDLAEVMAEGKAVADEEVVGALFRRCKGYYYKETKRRANEEGDLVVYEETEKYLPPDMNAITFWLKNRQSDEWKDKVTEEEKTTDLVISFGSKDDEDTFHELGG